MPTRDPHSSWRWICLVLGLLVMVLPAVQNFQALLPLLDLLDFMPLSYFLDSMIPSMLLWNASILAHIGLFIGGVLLIFGNRWGYFFVVSCCAFLLASILEVTVLLLVMSAIGGDPYLGFAFSEMFTWLGILPILVFLVEAAAVILLNFKGARSYMRIDRRSRVATSAIAWLLFFDFNFCLLISYILSR
jgi:hypothetical protein